jgi:hypothetical protein
MSKHLLSFLRVVALLAMSLVAGLIAAVIVAANVPGMRDGCVQGPVCQIVNWFPVPQNKGPIKVVACLSPADGQQIYQLGQVLVDNFNASAPPLHFSADGCIPVAIVVDEVCKALAGVVAKPSNCTFVRKATE